MGAIRGANNSGTMVANGGAYGSNSLYHFDYCLTTPKNYSFYIYDWGELILLLVSYGILIPFSLKQVNILKLDFTQHQIVFALSVEEGLILCQVEEML